MKRIGALVGVLLALAVVTALVVGSFTFNARLGGEGWDWLVQVLPFAIVALLAAGGLAGGLMWLAFYSARRGYDEPYDVNKPGGGRERS